MSWFLDLFRRRREGNEGSSEGFAPHRTPACVKVPPGRTRWFHVGFNHNVRYEGRTFHVQSDDLGYRCAHAITHVFDDHGHVVKTRKLSYAQFQDDTQVMNPNP